MTTQNDILSVREQIQQDILSFASIVDDEKIFFNDEVLDELCEIVVRNFEKLNWLWINPILLSQKSFSI